MNRAAAQTALDEAFAEGIKHAFGVLTANLIAKDAEAAKKFAWAVGYNNEAYAVASGVLGKIFQE